MSARVAILISGGGSNMVSLASAMMKQTFASPVLVLSNVPNAGGLQKAKDLGLETALVDHTQFGGDRRAFERAVHNQLEAVTPDVICLAGFMRILSAEFVAPWEGKMLNIHPSILPKYKGLHTHQRALDAGDSEHGCSVHEVTAALDDGPILGRALIDVLPTDTSDSLAKRLLPFEHRLYPNVLMRFVAGQKETVIHDGRKCSR